MVGALPRRPSADHRREGMSTASILAGPAVSRRRSSPPHEVPIAAAAVMTPFSLSSFSRSLSCSSSLSLSRALARVSSLPLPLLSLPLASVLYSRSFSLSPFSHARPPLARVLSLSLSAHARLPSRVFSLSLSLSLSLPLVLVLASLAPSRECSLLSFSLSLLPLPLASVLSLSLSLSRRSAGSAHFTCRAMSRAAYPVPPLRPFRRPSLRTPWRPPRHVASLPGPAGYTPPLDGSR